MSNESHFNSTSSSFWLRTCVLLVSGAAIQAGRGDELTDRPAPHSCTTSLHEALVRVNKSQWELSFLNDSEMICSSAHKNAAYFKSAGLSTNDAELATFSAWVQLKKNDHSATSVDSFALEGFVKDYRLLIVSSEPSEADVTIDANPCATPTECRYWVAPGTHEIVVSKKGYQTERKQQTVTSERATRISLTLSR
jgi:hypothetical protein